MNSEEYIVDCIVDKTANSDNIEWVGDHFDCRLDSGLYRVKGIDIMGSTIVSREPQITSNSVSGLFGGDDWIDESLYGYYDSIENMVNELNNNLNNGYNIRWEGGVTDERTRRIEISKTTTDNIKLGSSSANKRLLDVLGISKNQREQVWDSSEPLVADNPPSIYPINMLYVYVNPFNDNLKYSSTNTGSVGKNTTFSIPVSSPGTRETYENYQNQKRCTSRTLSIVNNLKVSFSDIYGNVCLRNSDWALRIRIYCED